MMDSPRSNVAAENPYASPSAEVVSPSIIWVDGAPRGVTLVDATLLGGGFVVAILLLTATRGIESLWLPSAENALGVYMVFLFWLQVLAQAIGWVVLARAWTYGVMPRAWEWIPLLAWLEFLPGALLGFVCQTLLGIEGPSVAIGKYHTGGLIVQLLATLILVASLVAMVVVYVRHKSRLTAVVKTAILIGLLWLFLDGILPAANHVVSILLDLQFPAGQAPQVWYVLYAHLYSLPEGIKWWIPFLAGFLSMGAPRRWTEWAGAPFHPLWLAMSVWLMFAMNSTSRIELAITIIGLFVAIVISCLVLWWRRPLMKLFGLSDSPRPLTAPKT